MVTGRAGPEISDLFSFHYFHYFPRNFPQPRKNIREIMFLCRENRPRIYLDVEEIDPKCPISGNLSRIDPILENLHSFHYFHYFSILGE